MDPEFNSPEITKDEFNKPLMNLNEKKHVEMMAFLLNYSKT